MHALDHDRRQAGAGLMRALLGMAALLAGLVDIPATLHAQTPQQRGWAKLADEARAKLSQTDDVAYYRAFPLARQVMLKWCAGPARDRPNESECRAARAAGAAR